MVVRLSYHAQQPLRDWVAGSLSVYLLFLLFPPRATLTNGHEKGGARQRQTDTREKRETGESNVNANNLKTE